jgi:hypothetical protein
MQRRWRKRGAEEDEFRADAFRRQSVILVDDEPSGYRGGSDGGHGGFTGFNPRPPTMIERHMANRGQFDAVPPMPSLQQYNNLAASGAGGAGVGYGGGYQFPGSRQPSFSPGQVIPNAGSPPPSATGAQFLAPYGAAASPHDSYNDQSQLGRQPSVSAAVYHENGQLVGQQRDLGRQNSVNANTDYVDLSRSSVTPYQAAQYAEISKKLNENPPPLRAVNENDEEPGTSASDRAMYADQISESHTHLAISSEEGDASLESPFADPQMPAAIHSNLSGGVPPSPIYTLHSQKTSQERVLSDPPTLPEIRVPEQTFSPTSYDFPQTPSARPTPSPFSTNFSIPSSPTRKLHNNLSFQAADAPPTPTAPAPVTVPGLATREVTTKPESHRPASTYTVYDETDAYGGF